MEMRIVKEIGQKLIAALMVVCVFSGIILMMCESTDAKRQTTVTLIGFGLFILGMLPGMIIAWKGRYVNGD